MTFSAVQYAVYGFGLRVVAVGEFVSVVPFVILSANKHLLDTGAEKKELCLKLGAEKWVDFRETKDLVKDIREAAGGEGPHAALVSATSVSP